MQVEEKPRLCAKCIRIYIEHKTQVLTKRCAKRVSPKQSDLFFMLLLPYQFKKLLLLLGDSAIYYAAIIISLYLRHNHYFGDLMLKDYLFYFTLMLPLALLILYINDLYDFEKTKNNASLFLAIIKSSIFIFLAFSLYFYFASSHVSPKTILLVFSFVLVFLLVLWRYSINLIFNLYKIKTKAVIISEEIKDRLLIKNINDHPEYHYSIKYFLNPQNTGKIAAILKNENIQTVIIGSGVYSSPEQMKILYEQKNPRQKFIKIYEFYENILQKIPLTAINEIYFLKDAQKEKILYDYLKRISDIILSLLLGSIFLLLLLPISLAIKRDGNKTIFYRQKRMGKNGKEFVLIKFRSMAENAERSGTPWTKENDPRITSIGDFLRKSRLDELPQVINIIKGEMSFIGPRPEQPELQKMLKEKIPFYGERNLIKPGLTGWAQIKHRYSSIDGRLERLEYDLYYIKNRSFALDLLIILKTINIILEGKGR